MKQPRKIALIDVRDCPRCDYDAYWQITVKEPPPGETEYHWRAQLLSYKPIGHEWQGKVHKQRPDVPAPTYPSDAHLLRQDDYLKLTPAEQAEERARQEAFRAQCAAIYEAHPKPVHLIDEAIGVAPDKDAADTAAQEWVRARMKGHRKPKPSTVHGYAIPLPIDPIGELLDELRYRWRKHARPLLMALGFSTTLRNNRSAEILALLDAGAGASLMRVYDGSRPATCGTVTTLLAELTHSDPAGTQGSGALTFSAITADASANATGTATWYRDVDSTGTCVVDGSVGTAGSDFNVNSTSISTGQEVSCSSKVYTEGNA
jgi:hypothetical protein